MPQFTIPPRYSLSDTEKKLAELMKKFKVSLKANKKHKMKKILRDFAILLFSVLWFGGLFLLLGCKKQPIVSTSKDSSYVETVRDTTIKLPGSKAETSLNIDSLNTLASGHWFTYFDSLNRVSIAYMRDKFGRLNLKAETKPSAFTFPLKTKTYVIREKHYSTKTEKEVPVWCWVAFGALGTLCIALFFRRVFF